MRRVKDGILYFFNLNITWVVKFAKEEFFWGFYDMPGDFNSTTFFPTCIKQQKSDIGENKI